MNKLIFRLSFLVITLNFSVSVFAQMNQEEVVQRIRSNSFPLKYRTAGNDFDDLKPLKPILQNARIVALGEATHGTREHFQFKHRMIEFLVRELGFTVFAMEVQYFKCLPINEYVLNGRDDEDVNKLITTNLSGIYQTEEVLGLVKWMHEYNKTVSAEKKVKFYGFDVQTPHQAADFLRKYLKKVEPNYALKAEKIFNETAPKDFQKFWEAYGKRTYLQKSSLHNKLLQMLGFMTVNESQLIRKSSQSEFETAQQAARVLLQSDQIRSNNEGMSKNPRDKFMAETVEYILNRGQNGAKAILWAHNFHIWKYAPNTNIETVKSLKNNGLDFRPMGNYLQEFFGDKYYSFGFVMDSGSFQAIDDEAGDDVIEPQEFTLKSSPAGSLGWYFSQTKLGDSIVNLREFSGNPPLEKWLTSPHPMRYAGASFSTKWKEDEFTVPVIPRESFDGLIFIENTTRSRSLSH